MRNSWKRWASARSRHNGSPTDTQGDTKSRSPHQGTADHSLTSHRRRCAEKWTKTQFFSASRILESKTKVGITVVKAPVPRTNPNTKETPTAPKPHTHPSHENDGRAYDPYTMVVPLTTKVVVYYTSKTRVKESCLLWIGKARTGLCLCLLWINKARAKDKRYIWVSVWRKTTN